MSQDNVALARRWFEEVWNQRRAGTIDEWLATESVCHADDGPIRGPQEFRARLHEPLLGAFPDIHVEVEGVLSQGDQVVVRWRSTGTHHGGGLGIPPTNQPVTLRGITWLRIQDGKLMEGWQHSNIPEVIRGLEAAAK